MSGPLMIPVTRQDEIDALATTRSEEGKNGAHEGVLTSMLNEMDGIQDLHGVIVVAATNRPDVMVRLSIGGILTCTDAAPRTRL
jgi:SpoVK/Ycf46/Vps4 family AAA+-type ATPase